MEITVTDDFFESELKGLKEDVLSGVYQKEMMKDAEHRGMKKATATYEELNP